MGEPNHHGGILDAAGRIGESFREHLRAECRASGERRAGLALRAACAMEWWRELEMRGREPEPLAADVVKMGKDRGYGANVAAGRLGAPGARIELLEDQLMSSFIDGEDFQQHVTN